MHCSYLNWHDEEEKEEFNRIYSWQETHINIFRSSPTISAAPPKRREEIQIEEEEEEGGGRSGLWLINQIYASLKLTKFESWKNLLSQIY